MPVGIRVGRTLHLFQPEPTAWSQLFAEDEFLCVEQSPGEVFESSAFA